MSVSLTFHWQSCSVTLVLNYRKSIVCNWVSQGRHSNHHLSMLNINKRKYRLSKKYRHKMEQVGVDYCLMSASFHAQSKDPVELCASVFHHVYILYYLYTLGACVWREKGLANPVHILYHLIFNSFDFLSNKALRLNKHVGFVLSIVQLWCVVWWCTGLGLILQESILYLPSVVNRRREEHSYYALYPVQFQTLLLSPCVWYYCADLIF